MKINRHEPREHRSRPPLRDALRKLQRGLLLIRVLALCANSLAHAQPVQSSVTPEQKFAPGYLESVATGYENGSAWHEPEGVAPVRPVHPATVPAESPASPRSPAPSVPTPSLVSDALRSRNVPSK